MNRKEFNLDLEKLNSQALSDTYNAQIDSYSLIGGGKIISTTIVKAQPSLINLFKNIRSKSVSIEFDESSIN